MPKIINTIYGNISIPDLQDDLIINTLRLHGEWAYCEAAFLAPYVRESDVIWDVGAFLGTFGLGLTQACSETPAELIAFEPSSLLYPCIKDNLVRNARCSSKLFPHAIGKKSGYLRPQTVTEKNIGAIAYTEVNDGEGIRESDVECKSLSEIRSFLGDYNFLKLDAEGMENEIIRSDIVFIAEKKPTIWAECNESKSSILLLEALIWAGYKVFYVAFPAFRKDNFRQSKESIYPMAYEAALLASPRVQENDFEITIFGEELIIRKVETSYDLRKALWATPRWSLPEWVDMSKPELIALIGRNVRDEQLSHFLTGC